MPMAQIISALSVKVSKTMLRPQLARALLHASLVVLVENDRDSGRRLSPSRGSRHSCSPSRGRDCSRPLAHQNYNCKRRKRQSSSSSLYASYASRTRSLSPAVPSLTEPTPSRLVMLRLGHLGRPKLRQPRRMSYPMPSLTKWEHFFYGRVFTSCAKWPLVH